MGETREARRRREVEDRRSEVKKRTASVRAARARKQRWIGAAVTAVVVLAGAATLYITRDRGLQVGRKGSRLVSAPTSVPVVRVPTSYRIRSTVDQAGTGQTTAVLSVRRPFGGRRETTSTGGATAVVIAARSTVSQRTGATDAPTVQDVVPAVDGLDVRVDAIEADATAAKLLRRREVRRVVGRDCQVRRTGRPLSTEVLVAPTAGDYVDSCVDAAGLVLEEVVVAHGAFESRRVATSVQEDIAIPDADLAIDPAATRATLKQGGGSVKEEAADARPPGQSYVVAAPAGFTLVNRFQVVPPQPENFASPDRGAYLRAATVDLFTRGADVIVFEQGGTAQGAEAFEGETAGIALDVPGIGPGRLLISGSRNEIAAARSGGRYVRISGTVSKGDLLALAAGLTEVVSP